MKVPETYGIKQRTAREIIRRHGAKLQCGLSPDQMDEAVERDEAGESLARIGTALAVAVNTVRCRLLKRGVTMRSLASGRG